MGQEPTPDALWWPRTHNHADLQSPPGARDGPAGPQSSARGRPPPYLKLLIPREAESSKTSAECLYLQPLCYQRSIGVGEQLQCQCLHRSMES